MWVRAGCLKEQGRKRTSSLIFTLSSLPFPYMDGPTLVRPYMPPQFLYVRMKVDYIQATKLFSFFFSFFYRLYIFHLFFLYPSISIALCVSLGDRKQLLVSFRSATGRKSSVANHWSISICWLPSHRYIKHTNGSASFITYYAGIKDK